MIKRQKYIDIYGILDDYNIKINTILLTKNENMYKIYNDDVSTLNQLNLNHEILENDILIYKKY